MPAPAREGKDPLNFCVYNGRKDGWSVGFQKLHIELFFPHNFGMPTLVWLTHYSVPKAQATTHTSV